MNTRTIPAIIAATALAFGLAACGGQAGTATGQATTTVTSTKTSEPRQAKPREFVPGAHNQGSKDPFVLKHIAAPHLDNYTDTNVDRVARGLCEDLTEGFPPATMTQIISEELGLSRFDAGIVNMSITMTYCPENASIQVPLNP